MSVSVTNPALSALQRILVYDIRVDGEAINLTSSELKQVEITNVENQHESAVITTQLTKTQIDRFINKPISFSYGKKTSSNVFYGYVVSINPNRNYQKDTIVDITCLGPTWVMQNGNPRFAVNQTVPNLFASVVTSYDLGAQVDTHPYTWPALAQSSESDWEFLQLLANRIGYSIYCYRGVVRLVKPLRILKETPVFQNYIKSDEILDSTRELLEWNATSKSLSIRENIRPSFGFFEGTTPSVTNQLQKPYRLWSDTPVKDKGMADTYVEAWNNRMDYWNNEGIARINGNAALVPGVNVSIQASGSPYLKNEYDGVWLVRGVKHSLTHTSFQTQMAVARDDTQTPTNTTNKWFWAVDRGAPKLDVDPTTNKWRCSWGRTPEYISISPTV